MIVFNRVVLDGKKLYKKIIAETVIHISSSVKGLVRSVELLCVLPHEHGISDTYERFKDLTASSLPYIIMRRVKTRGSTLRQQFGTLTGLRERCGKKWSDVITNAGKTIQLW